jgi:NAD(P)-dependent dehydrogenase (short-subunit alcohol dehydrogenase family)
MGMGGSDGAMNPMKERNEMSSAPLWRQNRYDLAGRVAVVTGVFGGLGPATALALLESGASVLAVAGHEQPDALERLRAQAGAAGERLSGAVADARDEDAVAAVVSDLDRSAGRLDILVNLIGGYAAGQPVTALDTRTLDRMLELNVRTSFLFSKHAARVMERAQFGRIINTASRAAFSGRKNAAAYAIAKAAIITLTETQAEEVVQQGITVNAVVPGIIDTPANRASMPNADFDRWPRPEEIARVIAFLASDDAGLISGAHVPVYGRS